MLTAGVDLAASVARTAAVEVEWGSRAARVATPAAGLTDDELLLRLASAKWVGIYAPFGWPLPMARAVAAYTEGGAWPAPGKEEFRYRRTDLEVRATVMAEAGEKVWPMSVSSDVAALRGCRLAQLRERAFEHSGLRFDRAGADRVVEVHPAAALSVWELRDGAYKGSGGQDRRPGERQAREALLARFDEVAPWLEWEDDAREAFVDSPLVVDAVVAALVARAASLGLTRGPGPDDAERAEAEGWIHLPERQSLSSLGSGLRR